MSSLALRTYQPELMDDSGIGFEEFAQTLRQLRLLNVLTTAYRPTLQALDYFRTARHRDSTRPLRILDIGSGYGDMLRKIEAWAAQHSIPVELAGVDLNPWAEKSARQAATPNSRIRYITADIFEFKPEQPYDVIVNSLFTHHLSDAGLVQGMKWMSDQARYGWFINDLHRHPIPYYFIRGFVRLFGFNRLIQNDAPLSVARAFVREDWTNFARKAGLNPKVLQIKWHWPFRWGVLYENQ